MSTIVLAALLAGAALGRAEAPAVFLSPGNGARLEAGTTVTIRWALGQDPGEQDREMELVLSLDGGRTFGIRVTGEIEPGVNRVEWRVPSVSCRSVRLALRAGDGTPDSEAIRIVSEAFEIRAGSDDSPEPFLLVDGESRTRNALLLPDSGPRAAGTVNTGSSLRSSNADESAFEPPRAPARVEPDRVLCRALEFSTATAPARGPAAQPLRSAPIPLRE